VDSKIGGDVLTYAKLISIGDLTPHGAPATFETKTEGRIVVMLEPEQCQYWHSRLAAILEKETSLAG
jgi:hypothetical protein